MALLTSVLVCVTAAKTEPHPIDIGKSTLTIRVYKAGLFSALGHNHEIAAPITRGAVDAAAERVELEVNAQALQVRDAGISTKDRTEIQITMLGPQVLDAARYPKIIFRSIQVRPAGPDAWNVRGDLTLHGVTRSVTAEVHQTNGGYLGSSRFKQTEFGITPVKVSGGAIRVKDELRIEFEIYLEHK